MNPQLSPPAGTQGVQRDAASLRRFPHEAFQQLCWGFGFPLRGGQGWAAICSAPSCSCTCYPDIALLARHDMPKARPSELQVISCHRRWSHSLLAITTCAFRSMSEKNLISPEVLMHCQALPVQRGGLWYPAAQQGWEAGGKAMGNSNVLAEYFQLGTAVGFLLFILFGLLISEDGRK